MNRSQHIQELVNDFRDLDLAAANWEAYARRVAINYGSDADATGIFENHAGNIISELASVRGCEYEAAIEELRAEVSWLE